MASSLTVLVVAACNQKPGSMRDCLAKALEKTDAKAIAGAKAVCQEMFASESKEPELPRGAFYYVNSAAECVGLEVAIDGRLLGGGCQFEHVAEGKITLACSEAGGAAFGASTVIYDVARVGRQILLSANGGTERLVLWPTLSECDRSISEEQRTQRKERHREDADAEAAKARQSAATRDRAARAERARACCRCLKDARRTMTYDCVPLESQQSCESKLSNRAKIVVRPGCIHSGCPECQSFADSAVAP